MLVFIIVRRSYFHNTNLVDTVLGESEDDLAKLKRYFYTTQSICLETVQIL